MGSLIGMWQYNIRAKFRNVTKNGTQLHSFTVPLLFCSVFSNISKYSPDIIFPFKFVKVFLLSVVQGEASLHTYAHSSLSYSVSSSSVYFSDVGWSGGREVCGAVCQVSRRRVSSSGSPLAGHLVWLVLRRGGGTSHQVRTPPSLSFSLSFSLVLLSSLSPPLYFLFVLSLSLSLSLSPMYMYYSSFFFLPLSSPHLLFLLSPSSPLFSPSSIYLSLSSFCFTKISLCPPPGLR